MAISVASLVRAIKCICKVILNTKGPPGHRVGKSVVDSKSAGTATLLLHSNKSSCTFFKKKFAYATWMSFHNMAALSFEYLESDSE